MKYRASKTLDINTLDITHGVMVSQGRGRTPLPYVENGKLYDVPTRKEALTKARELNKNFAGTLITNK